MRLQRWGESKRPAHRARSAVRSLAAAGLVGPVLFAGGVLAQQVYRRDSYDWVGQIVSDLTAGASGWVQQVNFVVSGSLAIAFAAGLQLGVRRTSSGLVGPWVLGLNGVNLVLAGVFPLREDAAGVVYDPLGVHTVNGALFFVTTGLWLLVISMALRADPAFRGIVGYVAGSGLTMLTLFVIMIVFARPADGPLHDWFGLIQRTALLVWLTCVVVLAVRLRAVARVSGSGPDDPGAGRRPGRHRFRRRGGAG